MLMKNIQRSNHRTMVKCLVLLSLLTIQTAAGVCPYERPSPGDDCSALSPECRYYARSCPGDEESDIDFSTICICSPVDMKYRCSSTGYDTCADHPVRPPVPPYFLPDESCDRAYRGTRCGYGPSACTDPSDKTARFSSSCTCGGSPLDSEFRCIFTHSYAQCPGDPERLADIPPEPSRPGTGCPSFSVYNGDECFEEGLTCRMSPAACPDTRSPEEIVFRDSCQCVKDGIDGSLKYACQDKQIRCSFLADVTTPCPRNPRSDDTCILSPDATCYYDPFGCPAKTYPPIFRKSCSCVEGVFVCEESVVDCNESESTNIFCFSGDSKVQVKNRGHVALKDLQIGDWVRTSTSSSDKDQAAFELIYSFGHSNPTLVAEFLQLGLTGQKYHMLQITPDHMLVVKSYGVVPASTVRVGDELLDPDNGPAVTVTSIKTVQALGAFAPFTPSGTIVVNGVVASCFVTLQENQASLLPGISHHWMAHSFEFPHRVACYYTGLSSLCIDEGYDASGVSMWVSAPLKIGQWLIKQNAVLRTVFLTLIVIALCLFNFLEGCILNPITAGALLTATICCMHFKILATYPVQVVKKVRNSARLRDF